MATPPTPELSAATWKFISSHQECDVRELALAPIPTGVDMKWALQQIEGRQLAKRKLPAWVAVPDLWWPSRLSLEQCSSQVTARYKAQLIKRLVSHGTLFADLTGGFGVDFAAIAPLFDKALHVENNVVLSQLVRHNLTALGLPRAECVCDNAESVAKALTAADVILLDPARRSLSGHKVVLLDDCTPPVGRLLPLLLPKARLLMVKLSPMFDITAALRAIPETIEVHVVSVDGECKELLLILAGGHASTLQGTECHEETTVCPTYCAALLRTSTSAQPNSSCLIFSQSDELEAMPIYAEAVGPWLYEPDPAILKAGATKLVATRYSVEKIATQSHLYTSCRLEPRWPGRIFRVGRVYSFGRTDLKAFRKDTPRADLSVRGFPQSVAQLRAQLKLKEGGDAHVFATTLANGQKVLIRTQRYSERKDNQEII